MTDDQFVAAFESCNIQNEEFHHEVMCAWAFLYDPLPALEGVRRFSEGLERLAAVSGRPNLYHEAITWGKTTC